MPKQKSKAQSSPIFKGTLSLPTRRVIVDLIDQIIGRMELELVNDDNADKLDFFRLPFISRSDNKTSGDALLTFRIVNKHRLFESKFKFNFLGIQKIDKKLSWTSVPKLLHEFKKEVIANRNTSTDTITKITIVIPRHEHERKYRIIINDDYEKPIWVDSTKPTWRLLLRVAKEKRVPKEDARESTLDYLNSNKQCRLYTQTGYSITHILKTEDYYIEAVLPVEAITERQYKQYLNKVTT